MMNIASMDCYGNRKRYGVLEMRNDQIEELKRALDDSIARGATFDEIYRISCRLDRLIARRLRRQLSAEEPCDRAG